MGNLLKKVQDQTPKSAILNFYNKFKRNHQEADLEEEEEVKSNKRFKGDPENEENQQ
jgi:hypothetical protein